ncbi:DUF1905 domain-containing protein [Candidatus Kaiserbacteria bacterium]|nr:MAG: DUF1905 domain-containing protein [Candidatus Kaiserbacteria bacterium]
MSVKKNYKIKAKVWLYPSETAAWHFVSLDKKLSAEIRKQHALKKKGFGSIPVEITLGSTVWQTSIFPSKDGPYVLPLKAQVRRKEDIRVENEITFTLRIR